MKNSFQISTESSDLLKIVNKDHQLNAIINLSEGGRLQEWTLCNNLIIGEPSDSTYSESYAGALLFPFVNRLEHGVFTDQDIAYQWPLNDQGRHAIHGLIFDKRFNFKTSHADEFCAKVVLEYRYKGDMNGFPFPFIIEVVYRFFKDGLRLDLTVINCGSRPFPFNLGWHPYFFTSNINQTKISMPRDKNIEINRQLIPQSMTTVEAVFSNFIGTDHYDHCYRVQPAEVSCQTPAMQFVLTSSSPQTFIQIYTPKDPNYVAIEPMTSPGNSFNNNIGLLKLSPNESFHLNWNIQINS